MYVVNNSYISNLEHYIKNFQIDLVQKNSCDINIENIAVNNVGSKQMEFLLLDIFKSKQHPFIVLHDVHGNSVTIIASCVACDGKIEIAQRIFSHIKLTRENNDMTKLALYIAQHYCFK